MDHSDYFSGYDTKPTVYLDDWCVVPSHSPFGIGPFRAPELTQPSLHGKVTNHPDIEDGARVKTTVIIAARGMEIETENTVYQLGNIQENYAKWCSNKGIEFDPLNPFGGNFR